MTRSIFLVAVLVAAAMACHHNTDPDSAGPIQRAGAWVDDTANRTSEGVQRGAEATGRGFENAGHGIASAFASDAGAPDAGL